MPGQKKLIPAFQGTEPRDSISNNYLSVAGRLGFVPEFLQMETTLLELLCAPLTHASLRLAHDEELRSINRAIGSGLLRNRAGEVLQPELGACLICDADRICYP